MDHEGQVDEPAAATADGLVGAPDDQDAPRPGGGPGTSDPARSTVLQRLRQGPGAGVAVVLGAAGLLFVASGSTAQGTDLRNDTADLASLVSEERNRAEGTTTLVDSLRSEVQALQAGTGGTDPRLEATVERMGLAAGMQPMTGPAVQVVLDDADPSSRAAARADSLDDLVVHQADVQAVVNALWLGGAEAMQLMDQRVISTSAVRCVGNTLSLQGQPYSPPYVITAIGDPAELLASLERSEGVDEYLRYVDAFGLTYDVDEVGTVEVPAYSGPLELRFAEVRST